MGLAAFTVTSQLNKTIQSINCLMFYQLDCTHFVYSALQVYMKLYFSNSVIRYKFYQYMLATKFTMRPALQCSLITLILTSLHKGLKHDYSSHTEMVGLATENNSRLLGSTRHVITRVIPDTLHSCIMVTLQIQPPLMLHILIN